MLEEHVLAGDAEGGSAALHVRRHVGRAHRDDPELREVQTAILLTHDGRVDAERVEQIEGVLEHGAAGTAKESPSQGVDELMRHLRILCTVHPVDASAKPTARAVIAEATHELVVAPAAAERLAQRRVHDFEDEARVVVEAPHEAEVDDHERLVPGRGRRSSRGAQRGLAERLGVVGEEAHIPSGAQEADDPFHLAGGRPASESIASMPTNSPRWSALWAAATMSSPTPAPRRMVSLSRASPTSSRASVRPIDARLCATTPRISRSPSAPSTPKKLHPRLADLARATLQLRHRAVDDLGVPEAQRTVVAVEAGGRHARQRHGGIAAEFEPGAAVVDEPVARRASPRTPRASTSAYSSVG